MEAKAVACAHFHSRGISSDGKGGLVGTASTHGNNLSLMRLLVRERDGCRMFANIIVNCPLNMKSLRGC